MYETTHCSLPTALVDGEGDYGFAPWLSQAMLGAGQPVNALRVLLRSEQLIQPVQLLTHPGDSQNNARVCVRWRCRW